MSLVGFDDATPTAVGLDLTTVRQPTRAKGEQAASVLLAVLAGDPLPSSPPLAAELILRGTTRAPS